MEVDELQILLDAVAFVWFRVSSFIDFANEHKSIWVPVGFSIARTTVALFRSAMGSDKNDKYL